MWDGDQQQPVSRFLFPQSRLKKHTHTQWFGRDRHDLFVVWRFDFSPLDSLTHSVSQSVNRQSVVRSIPRSIRYGLCRCLWLDAYRTFGTLLYASCISWRLSFGDEFLNEERMGAVWTRVVTVTPAASPSPETGWTRCPRSWRRVPCARWPKWQSYQPQDPCAPLSLMSTRITAAYPLHPVPLHTLH